MSAAYRDGIDLVQHIKAKAKVTRAPTYGAEVEFATQELEASLIRGENVVCSTYDRNYERFGEAFARGDRKPLRPGSSAPGAQADC